MAREAYARLWGRSGDGQIDALVRSVPARIGRALQAQQEDPGFIPIGASKSISKHHGTRQGRKVCMMRGGCVCTEECFVVCL